jgi:CheY-like chemotaxis protein
VTVNPSRRILLVEDDEDTRQLLAVALEAQGYGVDQAGDADAGLAALRGGRYDMVLTDYDLPAKTGAAMLREACTASLLDGVATLVVTAHPDPEGIDDATLVRKPLDLERFLRQVGGIFESMPAPAAPASGVSARSADVTGPPPDLALYISAASPASLKARRNMEKLLDRLPAAAIAFAVLDVAEHPEQAEKDNVVFTPTLVKRAPEPRVWILGDLSDPAVVDDLVHMCGVVPGGG